VHRHRMNQVRAPLWISESSMLASTACVTGDEGGYHRGAQEFGRSPGHLDHV
jgi:hypothetical protein